MDGGSTENPDLNSMEDLGCLESSNGSFIFTTIIWSFLLLLSFLLNATLLLAFVKRPGLRTISNRFVMNLSVSNLVTSSLLYPLLITDQSAGSAIHCTLAEGATALVTTSSIFSVLLIAIDQYLAVIDPLHYRTRIDNLKSTLLIIVVWFLSIIIGVLAVFNTNNNINSHNFGNQQSLWQNCRSVLPAVDLLAVGNPDLPSAGNSSLSVDFLAVYNLAYTAIYIIIIYLGPFIAIIWIYICIYTAAHNNSERTRRTGSRPVLTVASYLSDEDYLPLRPDSDSRIKNISSLSSIDETLEITSQLQRHLSPSPIIEEDFSVNNCENTPATHVIFTVGSHDRDIQQFYAKDCSDKGGNPLPYSGHIGDFEGKKTQEKPEDGPEDIEKNESENGNGNSGKIVPYIGDAIGKKDVEDLKDAEKIEVLYGIENGENPRPYIGHIGEYGAEDLERHLDDPVEDLKQKDGRCGHENEEYGMPYSSHMGESKNMESFSKKGRLDGAGELENGRNGKYGKLPYIGHIGESGKLYGIEELEGPGLQDQDMAEYGTENLPYMGPIAENGSYGQDEVDFRGHKAQNGGLMPPKLGARPSTRANYITNLRHRISNGSLFKYREETRAARISALVIVMGFVCWTPFFTIVVVKSLARGLIFHEVDVVGVGCFLLGTIVSPMLFGYRSRRVKRELKKLFCFKRELAYRNNRSLMAKKVLKRRSSATWDGEKGKFSGFWNFYRGRIKEPGKVQFVHVPETALSVDTCRSSFSSGASTQVSSASTDDC